jgi:hypothetical protein
VRGPGYNSTTGPQAFIQGYSFTLANNSSNSIIEGFYQIAIDCNNTNPINNITLRRNYLSSIALNVNVNGCIIENNVMYNSSVSINNALNVQVKNNIMGATVLYYSNSSTLAVKNNLFVCGGNSFYGLSNAVISNNIFFENNPMDAAGSNVTTSTFNNNLTYNNTGSQGIIPSGSNVGSGNIINTDPLFTGVYSCSGGIGTIYSINWRLITASPARNAGTDGTDIGPTGGASPIYIYPAPYPLTGEPAMPQVQSLTIPVNSVPSGGTLNVNVKARKRN